MLMSDEDLKRMEQIAMDSPVMKFWSIADPKNGTTVFAALVDKYSTKDGIRWLFQSHYASGEFSKTFRDSAGLLKAFQRTLGTTWEEIPESYLGGRELSTLAEVNDLPWGTLLTHPQTKFTNPAIKLLPDDLLPWYWDDRYYSSEQMLRLGLTTLAGSFLI